MTKTLHLTLKKKWFDMIDSGEKTEEYRELKDYWKKRLGYYYEPGDGSENGYFDEGFREPFFTHILFKNGYQKNSPKMTFVISDYFIREGNINWGAESGLNYFVFILGERVANG